MKFSFHAFFYSLNLKNQHTENRVEFSVRTSVLFKRFLKHEKLSRMEAKKIQNSAFDSDHAKNQIHSKKQFVKNCNLIFYLSV